MWIEIQTPKLLGTGVIIQKCLGYIGKEYRNTGYIDKIHLDTWYPYTRYIHIIYIDIGFLCDGYIDNEYLNTRYLDENCLEIGHQGIGYL